ncbi:MAG: cytochrome c biogenesis protein CcdA [Mycobacteriaceae bacterium]|nr:cytochrome c biogenesis protein CcdA [Mycobacteriaceae bacterium]
MDQQLVNLAFGAGLVAALNPCGFALLPTYLTLVVRADRAGQLTLLARAVGATATMLLGFMVVFGTFGLLTVSVLEAVQRYLPYVTVLIGFVLVVLGFWLLSGRRLAGLNPLAHSARWAPTARIGSMFGYGVGYALASLSCTLGPFLAVTAASFRMGLILEGLLTFLAYAAGMSLIVGVLAITAAFANPIRIELMRRMLPYINRIGGALVALVGLYVGYFGIYELRLFSGNGNPQDPVILAAARVQSAIVTWVYGHGAYPWLVALIVLVSAAVFLTWRRRSRRSPEFDDHEHSREGLLQEDYA